MWTAVLGVSIVTVSIWAWEIVTMSHNPVSYFTRGQFVFGYINFWMYWSSEKKNRRKYFLGHAVKEMFPKVEKIREGLPIILEEIKSAVRAAHVLDGDPNITTISKDRKWKGLYLRFYGPLDPLALEKCPRTCALLADIPEIKVAFVSVLEPGGHITPHNGPYKGILRYHLGLQTPNDDKCALSVCSEKYSWRDGEDVVFDDTYNHEVRNDTDTPRVILFADIPRPFANPLVRWFNLTLLCITQPLFHRWNSYQEKTE